MRSYRRGRKAMKAVPSDPGVERVHEWRKRTKDLWYQLRILREAWPEVIEATADELHELSDLLGDHHDLAVLVEDVRERSELFADREVVAALLSGAADRQKVLLDSAIERGERLYAEKPRPSHDASRPTGSPGEPAEQRSVSSRRLALPSAAMGKRYHVTTFGCQMNVHDSERMRGMLDSLGYQEAGSRSDADLILFNTCSIRESADNRFIAHLGEAKRLKSEDPERVVGVGGCWAQSVKDEVFERFPFVDVAFGPGQIHKLAEFLTSDSLSAQGYFEFEDFSGHLPAQREREFQGWLQISQGCNCACSYCIVPSTRGREVSRDPDELLAEVEALAADGVREVTLLGQNVNSYGRDLPRETPDRASPSCWRGSTRSRGSSGSATRARTRRTCART